jgi:hypothetical protein
MPQKKKPIDGAQGASKTDEKDSSFRYARNSWMQGERSNLITLFDLFRNRPLPPEFHGIVRDILEQSVMPVPPPLTPTPNPKGGRPKGTTRFHDDSQRREIVQAVYWLRKVLPGMTWERARECAARHYGISLRSVKQYCLDYSRRLR